MSLLMSRVLNTKNSPNQVVWTLLVQQIQLHHGQMTSQAKSTLPSRLLLQVQA